METLNMVERKIRWALKGGIISSILLFVGFTVSTSLTGDYSTEMVMPWIVAVAVSIILPQLYMTIQRKRHK